VTTSQPGRQPVCLRFYALTVAGRLKTRCFKRAVAMVLEPIYEQDFLDCSYGFSA